MDVRRRRHRRRTLLGGVASRVLTWPGSGGGQCRLCVAVGEVHLVRVGRKVQRARGLSRTWVVAHGAVVSGDGRVEALLP
jgi:hypothetical protein